MGSKLYETPHIDRLATDGMIFSQAYAACAVCSPTRASIMTGKYPARIGITDWIRGRFSKAVIPEDHQPPTGYDSLATRQLLTPKNPLWLNLEEITLAEMLKKGGYTTAHIGKWHLGPGPWKPEHQGFDFNYGGTDYGQPPVYFDPYERNGFSIENLAGRKPGEYLTDREGDEAARFIRNHSNGPFFLNMSHYAVHTPVQAKDSLIQKYKAKQEANPSLALFRPEDEVKARFKSWVPLDSQRNPIYAAMIESVDAAVGRMLHALDSLNLTENTLIVFFSDNGGHIVSTSNSPLKFGKGHPHEGGIREPMVVTWPKKIKAGTESSELVASIDFFPTLAEAAGIEVKGKVDGISLMPVLTENKSLSRDTLYWHFPHYWAGGKISPYSIIRAGDWKLIRWYESADYELYNLKDDLSETTNLSTSFPDKITQLESVLDRWLISVDAKMPLRNPLYKE
ncbi:UNVERIFIED_CONTAM: hypothetical protein GTU68_037865 [Idotea baltica]|nr:hypothetical protein [Idotea baltica]